MVHGKLSGESRIYKTRYLSAELLVDKPCDNATTIGTQPRDQLAYHCRLVFIQPIGSY